jgi:cobalt/nickel transport system permease protein
VKHNFTDRYAHLDSPVHRIDPRAKILASVCAIVIVITEPHDGGLNRIMAYLVLLLAVVLISRLPVLYVLRRIFLALPFIIAASALYPVSALLSAGEYSPAERDIALNTSLIIFSRALIAITILILLTSTEKFHRILLGLRKLRMPKLICSVSALLYRYIFLLADETLRTTRARESRTPGRLTRNRIRIFGNQAAMIFLRSWERSQTIYKSMLSRGFTGEYPDMNKVSLKCRDVVYSLLFTLLMLSIRIFIN